MKTVALGDIVSIYGGGTPDKTVANYWNGGIPWVTVKDFKSTEISSTEDEISGLGLKNSSSKLVPAGTILMPTRMAVGKVAIPTIEVAINQDIKAIVHDQSIDKRYLLHVLLAKADKLSEQATGATVKGITTDILRSLVIPLPSLDKQQRIALILDQVDGLRRRRRDAIAIIDKLGTSYFDEININRSNAVQFVPLCEVCEFFAGSSLPQGLSFGGGKSEVLLLKVSDLSLAGNDPIVLKSREAIDIATCDRWQIAPPLSVVFPKRGGAIATNRKRLLGRYSILDPNLMSVAAKNYAILNPTYLKKWFDKLDLVSISNGSTVPQINKVDLNRLSIALPSIQDQEKFADRMSEIDKIKIQHVMQLARLDALFISIQHRAFRGEL